MNASPDRAGRSLTTRLVLFGLLCAACAAGVWLYATRTRRDAAAPGLSSIRVESDEATRDRIRSAPHLVLRHTNQGDGYGRVALVTLDDPDRRYLSTLECERVYYAGGRGVCLSADRDVLTTYDAVIFDESFSRLWSVPLTGAPSRARVSRDGRFAAFTVFESGHSYTAAGLSTRTTILDLTARRSLGDLEQFSVVRDGEPFRSVDFNFWGVTFAPDSSRFYATLATGGRTLLVEGNLESRSVRVLREGVECPSLSPDGRRLVFKSRQQRAGRLVWQLRVLDLESKAETPLDGETRSVDDQAEWLDEEHVMYAMSSDRRPSTGGTDIWTIPARSGAAPRKLLEQAFSPASIR
jgi:hypothetical protein